MRTIPTFARKLVSASGIALATAMVANPPLAHAQSFQGTVASTFGSVTVLTGTNTTDITVSSPSAVINWTPTDQAATGGPINFQTAGTTATFSNDSSTGGNFAVLNRIIPVGSTRPIQFNGNVVSQLRAISGPSTPGGTVFFYSPGGILLGANAVFDVGNLALTTSDLSFDPEGEFDTAGSYVFQPATVPGSQISILPGAQISASADGSYVALVAPRVDNGGTINVNGSAALVAADAATITFSPNGLFDIEVDSGTSATGTVATNNGTITGPAAAPSVFHRVYMVAVAKNDAITMAIGSGSTLGFDIAGAANVVGNSIVLSAGHDVVGGNAGADPSAGGGTGETSVSVVDATITSNFSATATGGVELLSVSATGLDFASDVFVEATGVGANGHGANLFSSAAGAVSVAGDLSVSVNATGSDPLQATTGHDLFLSTDGGSFTVGGNLTLTAVAEGADATGAGATGGAGTGGFIKVEALNGGQIAVSGNALLDSTGFGGLGLAGAAGGVGTGGTASVRLTDSQATFGAGLTVDADGVGGGGTATSGAGNGGTAGVQLFGSTLNVTGPVYVGAIGAGADSPAVGRGGGGLGGNTNFTMANNATATLLSTLTLESTGNAGFGSGVGPAAAAGQGGTALVQVSAGSLSVGAAIQLLTDGVGGMGIALGDGGAGTGGTVTLHANGNSQGSSLISANTFLLRADGQGGAGDGAAQNPNNFSADLGGDGGNAQGGTISINAAADGGTITGNVLQVRVAAVGGLGGDGFSLSSPGTPGGRGGNGGSAIGGNITLDSVKSSGTTTGALDFDSVSLTATGTGAAGGAGAFGTPRGDGGNGGSGIGGRINAAFDRGGSQLLVSGSVNAVATGRGGNGGACDIGCLSAGGDATGGDILLQSSGATTGNVISIGGNLSLFADATGGTTLGATGGNASAGNVRLQTHTGLTLGTTDLRLQANAIGGNASSTGRAGTAQGGLAQILARGTGAITAGGGVYLVAQGTGGDGFGALTAGGAGTGGTSQISGEGGSLSALGDIYVVANGFGGAGNQVATSGTGGTGTGGSAAISAGLPSTLGNGSAISDGALTLVTADGVGGNAWTAGNGIGGQATIHARNGSVTLGTVQIGARGVGGVGTSGGSGGDGIGGGLNVIAGTAIEGASLISVAQMVADVAGSGGDGSQREQTSGIGGSGGRGQAGSIMIAGSAGNGVLQVGVINAVASARGGAGGAGNGASGGAGGNAIGGSVQIGSISGLDTGSLNTGTASFFNIGATANATGGSGGAGNSAVPGAIGGNGGIATGGGTALLVSGSQVTVAGTGAFQANAIGGNGGLGASTGSGGAAVVGNADPSLLVTGAYGLVTNRLNQPSQRGNLVAADLVFASSAVGGSGLTSGATTNLGRAIRFQVENSAISAANISFFSLTTGTGSGNAVDPISMINSTAAISGLFQANIRSATSLRLDSSSLTANAVAIGAANWVLDPVAPATLGTLTGTTSLVLTSAQNLVAHANLATQNALTLNALGRIGFGSLGALGFVDATAGGTITLGDISSGDSIDLSALGAVATGNLSAATSITVDTQGSVTSGNLTAGSGTPTGANGDLNSVGIRSGGSVSIGTVFAASDFGISAVGAISTGQATAYDMQLLGGGSVTTGGFAASNRVLIGDVSMVALGQTSSGFDKELVFAATPAVRTSGPIAIAGPVSATAFTAATQGSFTSGAITVTPSATGSGRLIVDAGGALTTANLTAANEIDLNSAVSIDTGDIRSQTSTARLVAPVINAGLVQGVAGVDISGQTVATENLTASAGAISAIGTQTISTGSAIADGAITITGGSEVAVGSASATNGAIAVTSAGVLGIGNVSAAAGGVRLIAGSETTTGGLVAGQGSINALNVQAAGPVQLAAGGAVASGTLRSSTQGVKVASFGSTVITGAINARTDALVSAAQSLTIGGAINARDVIVLSGGNVATGAVFAGVASPDGSGQITNATGRVLIASNTLATGNALLSTSTDYAALFAATPIRLTGTVNVGGSLVAGRFVSFSQGAMTGASVSAFGAVEVESGGLVTVAQRWGAPSLIIASADIRIVDNGSGSGTAGTPILSGIRTTPTGSVGLIAIGDSPALIGDGLSGTGYSLSAAEIGLVSTGELDIGAIDIATNPVDMLIGNLALTAGGAIGTSIASGSTGTIAFATGNRQTQTPGGAIRIVGNVSGTGFAGSNVVAFTTGRFELDAATGSLSLTQTGPTLGGTIELDAANIHVASGAILDRLAADPFYDGHVADLNRPATVQRPDGVLRALGLDLFPTGTLYIQNTGTTLDPAGFFADFEFTDLTPPANAAPASISVIVNGKWQTPTGIVGGTDARDLVVDNADTLAFYTADSAVNGCAINAASCVSELTADPTPAISGQIQVITDDPLGSTPQFVDQPPVPDEPGSGEAQTTPEEEEEARQVADVEAQNASSPLIPPAPLIDSTPLDPQLMIEQPVAGSGNPSLIGQAVNETSAEGVAQ